MPATRKMTRDGMRAVLTNSGTGLNAQLAAIATDYGLSPAPSINFTDPTVFIQGFIPPDDERISALASAGETQMTLALALYTSAQKQGPNEDGFQKSRQFSGLVNAHLDFYFVSRLGIEQVDTESLADAIEDATLTCFNRIQIATVTSGAVNWSGDFECTRDAIAFLGDGWIQRIPIQLLFEVNI